MIFPDKKLVRKAPKLESKRLFMRPFTLKDARICSRMNWETRGKPIKTIEQAEKYLKRIIDKGEDGYYLGVFLRETNELIGNLEFCHLSWYRDLAGELCYGFHENYWGKGYATEASKCFVDYLFRKVKMHKITADTNPYNFASQKVLYKLGFKLEGVAKEKNLDRKTNIWKDEYNWGLLRKDWLLKHKKPLFKIK